MHVMELEPGVTILHSGNTTLTFSSDAIHNMSNKEIIEVAHWFEAHYPDIVAIASYIEFGGIPPYREDVANLAECAVNVAVRQLARDAIKRKESRRANTTRNQLPPSGYVYLLKCGPYYKIGYSRNIDKRIEQLGTLPPFDIEVVCTIKTGNMQELEQMLHEQFEAKRKNGEWFELDQEDIEYIRGLA